MNADDKVILTGFGIALLVLLLLTPYLRRVYLNAKRPLAERYAHEISTGQAIIIPADPHRYIKFAIFGALAITFFLLERQLHLYIAQLDQTCVGFYGWNSVLVKFGHFFTLIYISFAFFFILFLSRYRQIMRDGYAPSLRHPHTYKTHIAFKLTPKLKRKWQLLLVIQIIICTFGLLNPFWMLHTLGFTLDNTMLQQLHKLNDGLQDDCLKTLHHQPIEATSPTPSPATSPPVPATASTRP